MSNQEKEFTFPKVDPQGLEPDQFRHYLTGAIEDYFAILAKIPPEQMEKMPWKIWRVHENGFRQEIISFPFYERCWWNTPIDEAVLQLPRISAFLRIFGIGENFEQAFKALAN